MDNQSLPAVSTRDAGPSPRIADPRPRSPLTQIEPSLTLLEVLLRHKTTLIACVVASLTLGVMYQLLAPRVYESTAEVFVERGRDGQPASPLAPAGVSAGQPSTHASLLRSTPVLEAAVKDPAVAATATIAELDRPVAFLRKNLSVSFTKDRETVSVSLRTGVPEDSALIVNAVVDAYLRSQQVQVRVVDADRLTAEGAEPAGAGVMNDKMIAARLMLLSDELAAAEVQQQRAAIRERDAQRAGDNLSVLTSLVSDAGLGSRMLR